MGLVFPITIWCNTQRNSYSQIALLRCEYANALYNMDTHITYPPYQLSVYSEIHMFVTGPNCFKWATVADNTRHREAGDARASVGSLKHQKPPGTSKARPPSNRQAFTH